MTENTPRSSEPESPPESDASGQFNSERMQSQMPQGAPQRTVNNTNIEAKDSAVALNHSQASVDGTIIQGDVDIDASGALNSENMQSHMPQVPIQRQVNATDINNAKDSAIASGTNSIAQLIKEMKIGHANVFLSGIENESIKEQRISLTDLHLNVWRKVISVFVKPKSYQAEWLQKILDQSVDARTERVFVVHGAARSGCFTTAVHLGLDLLKQPEEPKIATYRRTRQESRTLLDVAQSASFSKDTVYLVPDAFENGINLNDLSARHLPHLQETLKKNNNYLILITKQVHIEVGVPVLQIDEPFDENQRSESIDKHLAWYRQQAEQMYFAPGLLEQVEQYRQVFFKDFTHAYQVNRFFERISRADWLTLAQMAWKEDATQASISFETINDDARATRYKEILERLAKTTLVENSDTGIAPRVWFSQLSENARLYALLAGLFENISRLALDDIYHLAVTQLKANGITQLRDPREFGRDDLLEAIHAVEKEDGRIQFTSTLYSTEIQRQIDNWHYLLWSLVDAWRMLIELFRKPEDWEMRQSLGAAIGRLGTRMRVKLRSMLNELARHDNGSIVAVAGYALGEMCRIGVEHYDFAAETIEHWAKSNHPEDLWAAAANVWRVYPHLNTQHPKAAAIQQRLWAALKMVMENCFNFNVESHQFALALKNALEKHYPKEFIEKLDWKNINYPEKMQSHISKILLGWVEANANAAKYALRRLAEKDPDALVQQINTWLRPQPQHEELSIAEQSLRFLATQAIVFIFQDNTVEEVVLLENRHQPLLQLIAPLFENAPEYTDVVLNILTGWASKPGWLERIYSVLLHTINRANSPALQAMRIGLAMFWVVNENMDVAQVGQQLLIRCLAIDGKPLEAAGQDASILCIDASQYLQSKSQTLYPLTAEIAARVNLYAFHLGNTHPILSPGQLVNSAVLQSPHRMPRLIMPCLNAVPVEKHQQLRYRVVLSWRSVLDLEDLTDEVYTEQLLLLSPNKPDNTDREIRWIEISEYTEPFDITTIEIHLDEFFGKQLLAKQDAEWHTALMPILPANAELSIPVVMGTLNALAEKLDEPQPYSHGNDVLRSLILAGLWLAQTDLLQTVRLTMEWLSTDAKTSQKYWAGKALGKLLFKIYGLQKTAPDAARYNALLDLVEPLTRTHDIGSTTCILQAFDHWLRDPAWAGVLLGSRGLPNEARLYHPRDWFGVLVENTPRIHHPELLEWVETWQTADEKTPALRQAAARLQTHLSLGKTGELPELPEGKKYALLLLDMSERRDLQLASVIELLTKMLSEDARLAQQYVLVVGRLGQRAPVTIQGRSPAANDLLNEAMPNLPVLANALLSQVNPKQVGFVALFTNSGILDQDDWLDSWKDTSWLLCSSRSRGKLPNTPPSAEIQGWINHQPEKTAEGIVAFIRNHIKG